MPLFLLKITKRKWDKLPFGWLKANEVQGDPLGDLRIQDGTLSVWHIEDNHSNLKLIITALASNRDRFDKFDYGLFDQTLLDEIDIKIKETPGKTPIESVNLFHRDLTQLTINKTATLVNAIFDSLQKKRVLGEEIESLIRDGVKKSLIDLRKVKKSMKGRIQSKDT